MRLGLNQSLRTDLQLRLSPQILQRIEVLQLPTLDLAQMIEQELQQNEALEVDTDLDPEPQTQEEADDEFDAQLDAYESDDEWKPSRNDDASSRTEVLEATAEAPVTLHDHLREQLDELELAERERTLAFAVVASLNDRGWLEVQLDDLEVALDPPAALDELEHALHLVQGLEPTGVGCRDMIECLLLQLDPEDPDYQLLATLVIQHLDDIAHNRIPRIVRDTGADVDRVLAAIDAISHLDPVPGRRFGSVRVPHVRPDVIVRRVGDDEYEISLENDWIPSLTVSRSYLQMARDRSLDPELRKHLRGKIESARSLIDAVEQRKNTLFRVASELVNRQLDFLEHGKSRLRPLRMQEVADVLGVHVSTVSRAISGKYMQSPRGILPMKDMFTGEIPVRTAGELPDESESRASVQERIRKIIGEEDARNPLSDESIVQMLKDEHDLDIARRTVTKYRKALGLGSSRERRRYGSV